MKDNNIFNVETEDGVTQEAELLTIFEIEYLGKEYAIYTIPKDDDTDDIYGGIVVQDENGNDQLLDLETDLDKEIIRIMIDSAEKNLDEDLINKKVEFAIKLDEVKQKEGKILRKKKHK